VLFGLLLFFSLSLPVSLSFFLSEFSCHRTLVLPKSLVLVRVSEGHCQKSSPPLFSFARVHMSSSIIHPFSSYGIGTPLNASRAFVSRVADHILEESFELVDVVR
jgi:hypothetical protein